MTRSQGIKITMAMFASIVIMISGCGGGGGGTVAPARTSNLNLRISLPRAASSVVINSALIEVLSYDASGNATQVAYDSPTLTYNTTTYSYEGTYFIDEIPVGTNYVVKMTLNTSYVETYSQTSARQAGQTNSSTYTLYAGAVIPAIQDGVTADVTVDEESTIVAISAIKYAVDEGAALTNTSVVSSTVLSSLESAVATLIASNQIYPYYFISGSTDPFSATGISALSTYIDMVLAEAELIDVTSPTVSSFSPAAGATTVNYDGAQFAVIFNESMDSTVDLNNQTTLTASGFSITLLKSSTGGTLTIDSTNALSYGVFSWATVTNANDKLIFTLKSSATLKSAGLSVLEPNTTYTISTFTTPTNLTDLAGNVVSSTGITVGSFTTLNSTSVNGFLPANGALDVAYDGTVFAVMFTQSMDSTVNLNDQATLTASGFSITITRGDTGGSLTIDSTNALSYGAFSWMTSSASNDKLVYTLKASSALETAGLSTLTPETSYLISTFTPPSNLKDVNGNSIDLTGLSSMTGYFVTMAVPDTTAPMVVSTTPDAAAIASMSLYVPYDGPSISILFSESMDITTFDTTTFHFVITRVDTGSIAHITNTTAPSYGTFSWSSTNYVNDTLTLTMYYNSILIGNGVSPLQPSTTYTVSVTTAPTVTDLAGNPLDTSNLPLVGSFMTDSGVL